MWTFDYITVSLLIALGVAFVLYRKHPRNAVAVIVVAITLFHRYLMGGAETSTFAISAVYTNLIIMLAITSLYYQHPTALAVRLGWLTAVMCVINVSVYYVEIFGWSTGLTDLLTNAVLALAVIAIVKRDRSDGIADIRYPIFGSWLGWRDISCYKATQAA